MNVHGAKNNVKLLIEQNNTQQYVHAQNELLSVHVLEFIPHQKTGKQNCSEPHEISISRNKSPDIPCMDVAKFLVKDLFKERFHKFDDKPEHNTSWKYTFQSIVPKFCVQIVWDYTYNSYACVQE